MEILFKNSDIIVVIKPAGVSSEETAGLNMHDLIRESTGEKEIFTVHRLDNVTSGVMVYAFNKRAAAYLSEQIADKTFIKEYAAVVHGIVCPEKGIMEDLLFKDSRRNKSFVVKRERKGVKKASLEYSVTATKGELSLVKIRLHTGRTHQIRVQFASRKHPVYGDGKYGASDNITYIALFSQTLTFKEPSCGRLVSFTAELPHWEFFS